MFSNLSRFINTLILTLSLILFLGFSSEVKALADSENDFIKNIRTQNIDKIIENIESGVNINITIQDEHNITPLHIASQIGNINMVRILLSKGADPTITDSRGYNPFHLAAYHGHMKISSLLVNSMNMCKNKNRDIEKISYMTPLHKAVSVGNYNIVNLLIKKGADISAKNGRGETVLHIASKKGDKDILSALLKNNPNLEAEENNGRTPLHFAIKGGDVEIVDLLIRSGSNIESSDKYGDTPLHIAVTNGNLDIVDLLLNNGANPNSQN